MSFQSVSMPFNAVVQLVVVMIGRSREDRKSVFPVFNLRDAPLMSCKEIKSFGHFLTDDLNDDSDIYRLLYTLCSGQHVDS